MQLTETLVASSIFLISLACASNLATITNPINRATSEPSLNQKIDKDRLALQAHLEATTKLDLACGTPGAIDTLINTLAARAGSLGTTDGLSRSVERIPGKGLLIQWSTDGQTNAPRRRIYTPMGLGLLIMNGCA